LSPQQAEGKRLYLSACVSCHDRGAPVEDAVHWDSRPLPYPRNSPADLPPLDAVTSAAQYTKPDVPKKIRGLTRQEQRGARLFLANCAFCHGADGTGNNWIGKFLEPHPRNLTDSAAMAGMSGIGCSRRSAREFRQPRCRPGNRSWTMRRCVRSQPM
jgi:cytochrome c oxidase cbb3-type subunit 3